VNVETSPHPIIGYREWSWDPARRRLVGPFTEVAWEPGTTTASCSKSHRPWRRQHVAPDPGCYCGLYADYRPEAMHGGELGQLTRQLTDEAIHDALERIGVAADIVSRWFGDRKGKVYGAVALEGRVCLHESGLRGERARVVVLAYQPRQRALVAEIAALYDAEAVPDGALRQAAARFGVEPLTTTTFP
jgi:hypothetical protein